MKAKTVLALYAAITFLSVEITPPMIAQSAPIGGDDLFSLSESAVAPIFSSESTKFTFVTLTTINVTNIEELYTAVNDAQNAGSQIVIAPGLYTLSANDPKNMPRPNGGRIDLLENMSLQGVVGDREAVVIDAINLPASSYVTPTISKSGAIRMGRGTNAVEWLTIRNAVNGNGGIETEIAWPGTAHIRIAHIISTGNPRGIDLRNLGADEAGRVIEAEIIDNDLHSNQVNTGIGLRIANTSQANGGVVSATLSGNRCYNNLNGLVVEGVNTSFGRITVVSSGDRFYQNNLGAGVGGGLRLIASAVNADGNTTSFEAYNTSFENNSSEGLDISAAATYVSNATSNNNVSVHLRSCRFGNNQGVDISAIGALSVPESIGSPGTNNHATLERSPFIKNYVQVYINAIPDIKGDMNTVTVINR
jgi:hypothetical protein